MPTTAYGSWTSPVTIDMLTVSSVGLAAPTLAGDDLYWLESHAEQGGRVGLWRRAGDGTVTELSPAPFNVRSRVHEYGGGEYGVSAGVVVFSSFADGRVYRVEGTSEPRPLTRAGDYRYADLQPHPERGIVLAVREDHTGTGEPVNTIVAIDLDAAADTVGTVLCAGADFYSTPRLASDGWLAWTEWNHPNMPWDATRIRIGRLSGAAVTDVADIAGGAAESAVQPRWLGDGRLLFVSDRTDWWNIYLWEQGLTRPLCEVAGEFADPQWVFGQNPYAVIDDGSLLVTCREEGAAQVGVLTIADGQLSVISPGVGTGSVTVSGDRAAAVLSSHRRNPTLALLDLQTGVWEDVRTSSDVALDPAMTSVAEPVTWPGDLGPVHGWFYPPTNGDFTAPPGTRPPLITLSHGGPTSFSPSYFSLAVQYWTTRGFALLDVNYGGSTGYGRAYRQRLTGRWGIVDVQDCVAGALAIADGGRADRDRLAIKGGSAGGYTTLRALTASDAFSAGISLYGVGDLAALARDTHKFESRYLDGLVGPYPEAAEVYRERSPMTHLDRLSAPILLLQGADDEVVPPSQAEEMAAAARSRGLPVALLIFPGEGHGFRRRENVRASVEAQLYFLGRVYGFTPADSLPAIEIENLPGA